MQLKLVSLTLLSVLVLASPTPPLQRIPLTRRSLTQNGVVDIVGLKSHVENVRAKIARGFSNYESNTGTRHPNDKGSLRKRLEKRKTGKVPLTNDLDGQLWQGPIDVGTPAGTFTVNFDTGSSDLFVPGLACTDKNCAGHNIYNTSASSTAVDQCRNVTFGYADGTSIVGDIFHDTVSIGGLKATNQTVVAATQYSDYFDLANYPPDGLMGMAFPSISATNSTPVFQSLVEQGQTTSPVFGFTLLDNGGELFLGGRDTSAFTGDLTFTPLTIVAEPAFWQISVQSVSIGNKTITVQPHDAIVDTGTTAIYCSANASDTIYQGIFTVPCDSIPDDISFIIGGRTFTVAANTFNQGQAANGSSDCIGGIIVDDTADDPDGKPLNRWSFKGNGEFTGCATGFWNLGDVFLRNVYTEFDAGNLQVGFASIVS